jgi:hypothetical protein
VDSTKTTPAPTVGGRQVGQLLAGRYRLATSKGGNDVADVWHALDDATAKVVTLEILRDRDNDVARRRFLAEARRMAAIERPSVMRVSAIHDEATDTFIVFEHLIPLPVELTGLPTAAKDTRPVRKASADTTVVPTPRASASVAPPTIVDLDVPEPSAPPRAAATVRLPATWQAVSRSLASARSDVSRVIPWATRFAAHARRLLRDIRPEIRHLVAVRSRADLARATRPLIARARANRLALGGATVIFLAVVFVGWTIGGAIANSRRPAPEASPAVGPPAALAPAPFELPPLGAYGAAFESQGPYPTTSPNGTVEWVVALRNTGSVGWYRGIEGAQAALALPDGRGVAVQSTPYVAPGQIGWFVVRFRARAEVGTYTVPLLPRIDGRGPLPDLGIHTVVTVSKNP